MTRKLEVYKCDVCGNIAEVLHPGAGKLICCGKPMRHLAENTTDAATEKHVPVIGATDDGIKATIGEVPHPMEQEHHIEWVQLIKGDHSCRIFLSPGSEPAAVFTRLDGEVVAREYCNLHGLWKA